MIANNLYLYTPQLIYLLAFREKYIFKFQVFKPL